MRSALYVTLSLMTSLLSQFISTLTSIYGDHVLLWGIWRRKQNPYYGVMIRETAFYSYISSYQRFGWNFCNHLQYTHASRRL